MQNLVDRISSSWNSYMKPADVAQLDKDLIEFYGVNPFPYDDRINHTFVSEFIHGEPKNYSTSQALDLRKRLKDLSSKYGKETIAGLATSCLTLAGMTNPDVQDFLRQIPVSAQALSVATAYVLSVIGFSHMATRFSLWDGLRDARSDLERHMSAEENLPVYSLDMLRQK